VLVGVDVYVCVYMYVCVGALLLSTFVCPDVISDLKRSGYMRPGRKPRRIITATLRILIAGCSRIAV